jgi:hypothetical protein
MTASKSPVCGIEFAATCGRKNPGVLHRERDIGDHVPDNVALDHPIHHSPIRGGVDRTPVGKRKCHTQRGGEWKRGAEE